MRRNIHITPSRFHNASRILKETNSISSLNIFDEILIVALGDGNLPEHEKIDSKRSVWRVPLHTFGLKEGKFRGYLRYLEWMIKVTWYFGFRKKVAMVNSHSIMDLHIAFLIKLLNRKCKLIYDTHELETERHYFKGLDRAIMKFLERILIRSVDHIFVVSESIAEWYRKTYRLENVTTVRNIPSFDRSVKLERSTIFRDKFNIPENSIVFLFQGAFSYGRGIEIILNIFKKLSMDHVLIFMGFGLLQEKIKEISETHSNVFLMQAVPPSEVPKYASSADVGLLPYENTCLNHYYCSPNKLFEYAISGIPVLASNFPDISRFLDKYDCGWKAEVNEEAFRDVIQSLNKEDIKKKQLRATDTRELIGWDLEEQNLLSVYSKMFN
ncbi:glycosyltransferase [Fulvivirgaceae bacterium BMA10]|uniref:Glycosyltransferase n=1 Tax=Splendidivirga corallicola TaxID=3051826 RepID=A0ABT8KLR7_9BACT|nr:glycosyltransferase [Fulvivirgaceae bacterium BMA10]